MDTQHNDKIAWYKLFGPLYRAYAAFQDWRHPSAIDRLYSLQCLFEDLDHHEQGEALERKNGEIQSAFLELAQTKPKHALIYLMEIAETLRTSEHALFWNTHFANANTTLAKLSPEEGIGIFHAVFRHLSVLEHRDFLVAHAEKIGPRIGMPDLAAGVGFYLDDFQRLPTCQSMCDVISAYATHLERYLANCKPDNVAVINFTRSATDAYKGATRPIPTFLVTARNNMMANLLPAAFNAASLPMDKRYQPLTSALTSILKLGITKDDDVHLAKLPHAALIHLNQSGRSLYVLCSTPNDIRHLSPMFAASRTDTITLALEASTNPVVTSADFLKMSMQIDGQIFAKQYPHLVNQPT